jgi:hypothetical protein
MQAFTVPNLEIMEVWALLQSRRDTTNIFREILSDYTVSVVGMPANTILARSFRLFVSLELVLHTSTLVGEVQNRPRDY